jgi:hypothetical protein
MKENNPFPPSLALLGSAFSYYTVHNLLYPVAMCSSSHSPAQLLPKTDRATSCVCSVVVRVLHLLFHFPSHKVQTSSHHTQTRTLLLLLLCHAAALPALNTCYYPMLLCSTTAAAAAATSGTTTTACVKLYVTRSSCLSLSRAQS